MGYPGKVANPYRHPAANCNILRKILPECIARQAYMLFPMGNGSREVQIVQQRSWIFQASDFPKGHSERALEHGEECRGVLYLHENAVPCRSLPPKSLAVSTVFMTHRGCRSHGFATRFARQQRTVGANGRICTG